MIKKAKRNKFAKFAVISEIFVMNSNFSWFYKFLVFFSSFDCFERKTLSPQQDWLPLYPKKTSHLFTLAWSESTLLRSWNHNKIWIKTILYFSLSSGRVDLYLLDMLQKRIFEKGGWSMYCSFLWPIEFFENLVLIVISIGEQ